MVQSGHWVLVDLRPASRHREAHPQGAANVPLYKEVAGSMHV
jgi:rhodanese-related sulfurtransferase